MVTFRIDGLDRLLKKLEGFERQYPFILATTLNNSVDVARKELIDTTWAEHISVRNPSFLKAALTTRGRRATKASLRVELYDQLGRGALKQHDIGGTKVPKGGALAVPVQRIRSARTSKGVPKGMAPRALARSFGKPGKSGDMLIFQQTGKYRKATKSAHKRAAKAGEKRPKGVDNRSLSLAYVLKRSTKVRADVPFSRDFQRIMKREIRKQFDIAMKAALKTAFRN